MHRREGDWRRVSGPTAEEAAAALSGASEARREGRRAAVAGITRAPLVIWGCVWCADYAAFQFLSTMVATLLAAGLAALAFGLSRHTDGAGGTRSGWDREVIGSWWVLVVGSVGLGVIAGPAPEEVIWLLVGAFWGVALALYAAVCGDRALGGLGMGIVVAAVVLRLSWPPLSLLLFGLVSGGAMVGLGLARWLASPGRAHRRGPGQTRAGSWIGRWPR